MSSDEWRGVGGDDDQYMEGPDDFQELGNPQAEDNSRDNRLSRLFDIGWLNTRVLDNGREDTDVTRWPASAWNYAA